MSVAPAGFRASLRHPGRAGAVLLGLPTVVFLLVLFAIPVARFMLAPLAAGMVEPYVEAMTGDVYRQVIWNTFKISAYVTVLAFLLGYPVAYFLTIAPPFWRLVGFFCVLMPFWTSILVRTYAWLVILGRQGIVNEALLAAGIIDKPIVLLHSMPTVLLGMVHVLMPFFIFPVYAIMQRIDMNLIAAARGLGAPDWRVFTRVYLPLTLPGVLSGATLVFILSMGFFITPALLGGGRVTMIAVLIEQHVNALLDWEFAGALSAVLLAATLVVYGLMKRFLRGDKTW
ncbi:ABC transporter permease [Kaustia mangrovi]|uniref:ABC transporter permease n=1 Tax=Kaustia mangrovi TaxID=2593653 RepID=A0A7S8C366_9HYPH|nr:ABC transporter permease [Kaustia mangrovi]QPC42531.1 ABC transporter permease [Kaustia mangrovi]